MTFLSLALVDILREPLLVGNANVDSGFCSAGSSTGGYRGFEEEIGTNEGSSSKLKIVTLLDLILNL